MTPGDKPQPPHCALARFTGDHDEHAFRWRLWRSYRVLVVNLDDERLSEDQRNGLKSVGQVIFERGQNGDR